MTASRHEPMNLPPEARLIDMSAFDPTRMATLRDVMAAHVEQDRVGGGGLAGRSR
jgi:hypothetical protein